MTPFEKKGNFPRERNWGKEGEELSPQPQDELLGQVELEFRSFVFQACVELIEPVILILLQ